MEGLWHRTPAAWRLGQSLTVQQSLEKARFGGLGERRWQVRPERPLQHFGGVLRCSSADSCVSTSADSCVSERDMPEMSLLHTSQEKMPPKDAEEAPEALEWEDE